MSTLPTPHTARCPHTAHPRAPQRLTRVLMCALSLSFIFLSASCTSSVERADQPSQGSSTPSLSVPSQAQKNAEPQGPQRAATCPAELEVSPRPEGTRPEHLTLEYWLKRWGAQFKLDEPLMSARSIEAHNLAASLKPEGSRAQADLRVLPSAETLSAQVKGRLEYVLSKFDEGIYAVEGLQDTTARLPLSKKQRARLQPRPVTPLASAPIKVALRELQLLCAPLSPHVRKTSGDVYINRNACTRVKAQAPFQVLAEWPDGFTLVRSRLALGWLPPPSPQAPPYASPALTLEEVSRYLDGPFTFVDQGAPTELNGVSLKAGLRLPLSLEGLPERPAPTARPLRGRSKKSYQEALEIASPLIATASGVTPMSAEALPHRPAYPQLTRRDFLTELFKYIGVPYGLGGERGGTDCSRLVVNVLETMSFKPPRFSGHLAEFGTFSVDLPQEMGARERLNLLDEALKVGPTLYYIPGHMTTYLGRDEQGEPMLLHALSDFQQVCDPSAQPSSGPDPLNESVARVGRTSVTTTRLGEGSTKGAYLMRGTKIVVFGAGPSPALAPLATSRAPAPLTKPSKRACKGTKNRARIFTSPAQPHLQAPLRVMVTRPANNSPAALTLYPPHGAEPITPELKQLGGPPYVLYAELPPLKESGHKHGWWRLTFGEGSDWESCTHIKVERRPQPPQVRGEGADPALWTPQEPWTEHTEALFAGFVERLFQYPITEDKSWTNLQDLINVQDHNLLFNHLSADEDQRLKLRPDCADLPYTLRAYFAWKMRLPMAYMTCTRGSKSRAPQCQDRRDSTMPREGRKLGEDFQWFARKGIAGHVHSASARTLPFDEDTDLYPIALTREALRPGVVFADPYGHLLLIAGWLPQARGGYGVLIGADGQPDGTISRRRFWQGSFLFDPEHKVVGAGFKAFRPLVPAEGSEVGEPGAVWRPLSNQELSQQALRSRELKRLGLSELAISAEQYEGSRADFYDKVGALMSPRPINLNAELTSLVDALHESARRRVLSVNNGEGYMKRARRPMKMPRGYSIFETAGPWEDFATPSRDMRLLIAIDTVLDLPSALRRRPERFGLSADEVESEVVELKAKLTAALKARSFEYTRSDGHTHTLSLYDLVERAEAMEMAYNPNDCVEIRWGAPQESAERASCQRHAPKKQRKRMGRYRSWFKERKRPPRGTR